MNDELVSGNGVSKVNVTGVKPAIASLVRVMTALPVESKPREVHATRSG